MEGKVPVSLIFVLLTMKIFLLGTVCIKFRRFEGAWIYSVPILVRKSVLLPKQVLIYFFPRMSVWPWKILLFKLVLLLNVIVWVNI
jgi:hypothetical protein